MLLGDPLKILFRQPRLAGKHVTLHGCARQKSRGTGDDGLPADHLARYVDAVAFKDSLCDIETDCRARLHNWLRIVGALSSTHIHGPHVPVEEPSTASKADITALLNQFVSAGESRR